jgi:predicted phage terminase large subunit-like protein
MTIRDMDPRAVVRLRNAACRTEFASFTRRCFQLLAPGSRFHMNWHILSIAYRLEQVRRGIIRRLIINAPPRTLKSFMSSVAFPAFVLGHDPTKCVIGVSYSSDLAIKHSNDFRAIMTAPWYQSLFPGTRISRTKNTESEVVTTANGFRLATSIDGTLTGRGGDIMIIDDPLKPSDALSDSRREYVNNWFGNTLLPRLNDKVNGAIVIAMQRLHIDDLPGMLLRTSNDWTLLNLSAIAEQDEKIQIGEEEYHIRRVGDLLHAEREPRSVLDSLRSQLGPDTFAAQYQQAPVPPGGMMIKREWIRRYDEPPDRTSSSQVIQSWDTASKAGEQNDWSVCTVWLCHEKKYYLIDVLRDRFDYPTMRARASAFARTHKANKVLIEDAGVGTALVAELQKEGISAIAVKPEKDKRTRMSIQSAKFQSGQVFFPNGAPWLADLEAELFAFPMGRHDDQVDSISQALAHQIEALYWDAKSTEAYSKLLEGLIMDRYWGNVFGRPW